MSAADSSPPPGEPAAAEKLDFSAFIVSLSASAMCHLGEVPHPETSQPELNLPLARQTIDILGILQEKTRGNLTEAEDKLLTTLLYDLRMKYIAVSHAKG